MRRSTLTTAVAAPAILALSVFVAGCGGDDADDTTETDDAGTEETEDAGSEDEMTDEATDESTDA